MSIIKTFADPEVQELVEDVFGALDEYFSESGERRRFIRACQELSKKDLHMLQSVLGKAVSIDEARVLANSADSPLRLASVLLTLETKLEKTKDKALLCFIFTLLEMPKVVKGLDRLWMTSWESPLLRNRQLTSEQIISLWNKRKAEYYKELRADLIRQLVKLPNCPAEVMEELLGYDDSSVRKSIGLHKNISQKIVHYFLNSPRKPERFNISRSRYVSSEVLLSLMGDKYEEIVESARGNFKKRFPNSEISEERIEFAVLKNIEKPQKNSAKPKRTFDPRAIEKKGLQSVAACKDSNHRKRIADKTNDSEVLRVLSNDKSSVVRRAVANRYCCPEDVLMSLILDDDTKVSNNAFKNFSRAHPECIAEQLLRSDVVDAAFFRINHFINENTEKSTIYKKLSEKEEAEFERLFLVVTHTQNYMIQLRIVNDLDRIPPIDTLRWQLLAALSDNRNLSEMVIRKIAIELRFGDEKVLGNCKNTDILHDFLKLENIPFGVKSRIQERFDGLIKNASFKGE